MRVVQINLTTPARQFGRPAKVGSSAARSVASVALDTPFSRVDGECAHTNRKNDTTSAIPRSPSSKDPDLENSVKSGGRASRTQIWPEPPSKRQGQWHDGNDRHAKVGGSPQRDARLRYHAAEWEPERTSLIAWRGEAQGKCSAPLFALRPGPEPVQATLAMSCSRCSRSENQVVSRFAGTASASSFEATS